MYMRLFLPDSVLDVNLSVPILSKEANNAVGLVEASKKKEKVFKSMPSSGDMVALLKTRLVKAFVPADSKLGFFFSSIRI